MGPQETDGQTTMATHPYQKENQKIELVTKSYSSSAWCCQSSETAYDQSQIDTVRNGAVRPQARPLTFKEKVAEMIGWGSCTTTNPRREQATTLDFEEENKTGSKPVTQYKLQGPPPTK